MSNGFFEHDRSAQNVAGVLAEAQEEVRRPVHPVRRRTHTTTPVPPRASAYPGRPLNFAIRPRYTRISAEPEQEEDITRLPTQPTLTANWQYEEADVAEEDTASMPLVSASVADERKAASSLEEEDTAPCPLPQLVEPDIAELDTQPPDKAMQVKKTTKLPAEEENSSVWNFPQCAPAPLQVATNVSQPLADQETNAQFVPPLAALRSDRIIAKRALAFYPFDHVRWWLLYPGRLEFVLWLSGTLLLLTATCLLFLFSFLSMSSMQDDSPRITATTSSASPSSASCLPAECSGSISVTSVAGVKLTLLDTGQTVIGKPLHLEGQGFTPHGAVNLTYDAWQPGQPSTIHADAYGTFRVTVLLTHAGAGEHRITAYDVASTHTIVLPIKLVTGSAK